MAIYRDPETEPVSLVRAGFEPPVVPIAADPATAGETPVAAAQVASPRAGLADTAALAEAADPAGLDDPETAGVPILSVVTPPAGWNDMLTGTDGPRFWDRIILSEGARVRRYKRPSTVVLVEIDGLERLTRLWGADVGERTLIVAARTLSKEIRSSDHIARIEPLRFGVLLTETTEIDAINFVERARVSCERQLRVASEVVSVAFGWASPPPKRDLSDALALAERRLAAELRTR